MGKDRENTRGSRGRTGILGVTLRIFLPFLLAVGICLSVIYYYSTQNQRLTMRYIEDTSSLYLETLNATVQQINANIALKLHENDDAADLPDDITPASTKAYPVLHSLYLTNQKLCLLYQDVTFFYEYRFASGLLVVNTGSYFRTSQKPPEIRCVTDFLAGLQEDRADGVQWTVLTDTEGKSYLFSWYIENETAMGCVMSLDAIFERLRTMNASYEVTPTLTAADGRVLSESSEIQQDGSSRRIAESFSFPLYGIGIFHLSVFPSAGELKTAVRLREIVLILILVLSLTAVKTIHSYYKKILVPMQAFPGKLKNGSTDQKDTKDHLLELDEASEQFSELQNELDDLRIAYYRKQLEQQKTELEYSKERIKPHFFINCLSIIHGIAESDGEEKIAAISSTLSNYLRYIFHDMKSMRTVKEELAHVQDYIDIQKIRYSEEAFTFEAICDGGAENELIPVLMLQTVVENCFSHGMIPGRKLSVTLYIVREHYDTGDYLYITVSDDGKGFPEEILESLKKGEPIHYDGRNHIGLLNIRKRLQLRYGSRAELSFSNMGEEGGAVVEIRFPILPDHALTEESSMVMEPIEQTNSRSR